MKRFYQTTGTQQHADRIWRVTLDGKAVRTPKKTFLDLPSLSLAEAVAAEWDAQEKHVKPQEMPLTTLSCTALDLVRPDTAACVDRIMPYLCTDSLLFEDELEGLAAWQLAEWAPLRAWFDQKFGVQMEVTRGMRPPDHPVESLEKMTLEFLSRDEWELCALEVATNTAKSAIVATALLDCEKWPTPEQALRWALLEEFYQIERWGLVEGEHDVAHEQMLVWLTAAQSLVRHIRHPAE